MKNMEKSWFYDESRQIGTNYRSLAEIEAYDTKMASLRDPIVETERIAKILGFTGNEVVADIGCGTAEYSVRLADKCALMYGVDISNEMLVYGNKKAKSAGVSNVRFEQGGFLSWDHDSGSLDVIITCMALHHLPDFWKLVGLQRLQKMLRPGGVLYIYDVIYSFEPGSFNETFSSWCKKLSLASPGMEKEAARHIRDEYSTTSWLMEEMLKRTGFNIEYCDTDNMVSTYICRKPGFVGVNGG